VKFDEKNYRRSTVNTRSLGDVGRAVSTCRGCRNRQSVIARRRMFDAAAARSKPPVTHVKDSECMRAARGFRCVTARLLRTGSRGGMTTPAAEDGALPLTAEAAKLAEVQKLVALRDGDGKILARACWGIGLCAAECENEAANGSASRCRPSNEASDAAQRSSARLPFASGAWPSSSARPSHSSQRIAHDDPGRPHAQVVLKAHDPPRPAPPRLIALPFCNPPIRLTLPLCHSTSLHTDAPLSSCC
jgi:hypothetical protein